MAIRTDEVQLRVLIDGSPARKELAQLDQAAVVLRESQKKLQGELDAVQKKYREVASNEALSAKERKTALAALNTEMHKAKSALSENARALATNTARQSELRKEIGVSALQVPELQKRLRELNMQLRAMGDGPERVKLEKELLAVKQRLQELTTAAGQNARVWAEERKQLQLTDLTMAELEKESGRLHTALKNAKPSSAEWAQYRKELQLVDQRQQQLARSGSRVGNWMRNVKNDLKGAAGLALGFLAGNAIMQGFGQWVRGLGDTSDRLADMAKATDKTDQEVRELDRDLSTLATRTSKATLRDYVVGLGQAGVAATKENVAAIDRIGVALGDAFKTGGVEIANTLTVVRNNLTDFKSENYAEDVSRIGNAFNVLEAEGLATGPVLADVTNRVAGVARTYNVTSGEILGMAATFQELGIAQERGSTAYTKTLGKMASESKKFGKVVRAAGLDEKQFYEDLNNDMQAAFVTVAKAVRMAGKDNVAFGEILKDLDADGAGVSEVLAKIGANEELLAKKTRTASDALLNQDSITAEFNKKNNTLGANLEKIGKWMSGLFVNSGAADAANKLARSLADMVSPQVSDGMERERQTMQALYYQILQTNEGSEARTKLIQKLKEMYPGYLKDLDAEHATNDQVTASIQRLNREMINRIVLQKAQEEVDRQQEKAGEAGAEFVETESQTLQMMAAISKKFGVAVRAANSTYEQAANFRLDVIAKLRKDGGLKDFVLNEDRDLNELIMSLGRFKGVFDRRAAAAEAAIRHKQELETLLGLQGGESPFASGDGGPGAETSTDTTLPATDGKAAENKEQQLAQHLEAVKQMLAKAREDMLQDSLSADEREIRQLDAKHAVELADLAEHQKALIQAGALTRTQADEQVAQLESAQETARANLIEQQGEKRLAKAREADAQYIAERRKTLDTVTNELDRAHLNELYAEVDKWDRVIAEAEKGSEEYAEAERKRYAAQEKLADALNFNEVQDLVQHFDQLITEAKKYGIDTTELEAAAGRAKKALQDRQHQQTEESENNHQRTMLRMYAQQARNFGQVLQGAGDLFAGLQQFREAQVAAEEKRADADGKRTQDEIARINARKAAARNAAMIQIYTQMGIAIANGVANAMTMQPWPVAVAAAAATVGTVMGLMAQAQGIASGDMTVENGATGSTTQVGEKGIKRLVGPSHGQGGIGVYNESTGERAYELEGGEAVINKDVVNANEPLIDAMLAAAHRSNKKLDQAVLDRVLAPVPSGQPVRYTVLGKPSAPMNLPAVRRALAAERFAHGGVVGGDVTTSGTRSRGESRQLDAALYRQSADGSADMRETNGLLRQLITKTEENTDAVKRSREFNQGYDRAKKRWDLLKASNTAKRHRT